MVISLYERWLIFLGIALEIGVFLFIVMVMVMLFLDPILLSNILLYFRILHTLHSFDIRDRLSDVRLLMVNGV